MNSILLAALALVAFVEASPTQAFSENRYPVKETLDIVFAHAPVLGPANTIPLALDVYEPDGPDAPQLRPAFIAIHGGGFRAGDKRGSTNMVEWCRDLAARGFVCLSINYRLERDNADNAGRTFRDRVIRGSVEDASAAMFWLEENAERYKVDMTRLAIGGGSAGATTALLTGYANPVEAPPVRAIVDLWGGMDHTVSFIKTGSPALLIVHGTRDQEIPHAEALRVASRATTQKVPLELYSIEGAGHGVSLSHLIDGQTNTDSVGDARRKREMLAGY